MTARTPMTNDNDAPGLDDVALRRVAVSQGTRNLELGGDPAFIPTRAWSQPLIYLPPPSGSTHERRATVAAILELGAIGGATPR